MISDGFAPTKIQPSKMPAFMKTRGAARLKGDMLMLLNTWSGRQGLAGTHMPVAGQYVGMCVTEMRKLVEHWFPDQRPPDGRRKWTVKIPEQDGLFAKPDEEGGT